MKLAKMQYIIVDFHSDSVNVFSFQDTMDLIVYKILLSN